MKFDIAMYAYSVKLLTAWSHFFSTDINNKQELANSDVLLPSVRIESAEERKKLNSLGQC